MNEKHNIIGISQCSNKIKLYPCCWRLAFHWDSWENCATKPEVEKFKMAASKLQMLVSPLPDKISTKFQRLYPCFLGLASHWDSIFASSPIARHIDFDALKVRESEIATTVFVCSIDWSPFTLGQSNIMSSTYKIQPTNIFLRTPPEAFRYISMTNN